MLLFIPLTTLFLLFSQPDKITSTHQLVEAMHQRYAGKWAQSITFVQHNTHYANDTIARKSVWYEAIQYPDKFRIDFGDIAEGNAVIFAQDSVFSFKSGTLQNKRSQSNNLILLAGGLHFLHIDEVLKRLNEAGYNISRFHESNWQGRPAYVVGADKGDESKAQFWIDRQYLYLVRTLTPTPDGQMQEAQFTKHQKTAGGWIETEVLFLKDGKKQQLELYSQITVNPTLTPELFKPEHFGKVHWRK